MAFATSDYDRVVVDIFRVCSIGELCKFVSAHSTIDVATKHTGAPWLPSWEKSPLLLSCPSAVLASSKTADVIERILVCSTVGRKGPSLMRCLNHFRLATSTHIFEPHG